MKNCKKIAKFLVTFLTFVLLSFILNIATTAVQAFTLPVWSGSMPSSSANGITGYFPQSYSGGIALCNDDQAVVRWGSKDYEVHYPTLTDYYSTNDRFSSANDRTLIALLKGKANKAINATNKTNLDKQWINTSDNASTGEDNLKDAPREYPGSVSVSWVNNDGGRLANDSKPLIAIVEDIDQDGNGAIIDYARLRKAYDGRDHALKAQFDKIAKTSKPQKLQTGYDSTEREYPTALEEKSVGGIVVKLGPQVAVSGTGSTSSYSNIGGKTIDTRSTSAFEDIMTAYIYSGEYHKSRQNPTGYDLIDVQVANWLQNDHNQHGGSGAHGYNADGSGSSTITQGISSSRGRTLYLEARDFYKFISQYKANGNKYVASVNTSSAQVFVSRDDSNRGNDEYIIGPVSISYPYYHNISYMTDIILEATNKDGGSSKLSYKNSDFKIVMQSKGGNSLTGGTAFPGENGISNENFYIIVNASKAAYPDTIKIRGEFEYTDYCKTQYTTWYPKGGIQVYRYVGLVARGIITYTVKYYWADSSTTTTTTPGDGYAIWKDNKGNSTKVYPGQQTPAEKGWSSDWHPDGSGQDPDKVVTTTKLVNRNDTLSSYAMVMQGIIIMDCDNKYNTKVTDIAQEARKVSYFSTRSSSNSGSITVTVDEPESSQSTYAHKASAKAEESIDLTIKIGGKVWVDGEAGKESKYDGQFNGSQDRAMSNVTVKLHQRTPNGSISVKAQTKTDGNGQYSFESLNALYTYYVEFVYNGQYYQPTIYKNGDWANSSKGLDIISERQAFNAKFAEIGSNPQNYAGGPVYTRDDLKNGGYIDEFGNPTGNYNQYVNDCMMSSYTGYNQGGFNIDYYPVYNKFVIGREINGANKATITRDSSGQAISSYNMLYAGNYNNLCVNQGYVLREIADLAARKDVLQTTLEMNGKNPQVYKYNKNNDSGAADISVRVSDYYYGTNYTREIYKEDYFKPLDNNEDTKLDADDWLKIYVTYKIRLTNQSETIAGVVQEIVDYYDDEYTLIGSDNTVASEQKYKPYIGDRNGKTDSDNILGKGIRVTTNNNSKYGAGTESNMSGYNKTYIRTDSEIKIPESGGDLYIFLTFRVNSINNLLVLDDGHNGADDNGKANIIEINGYKTYYTDKTHAPNESNSQTDTEYSAGDISGLVDRDSIAGNLRTDKIDKNTSFANKSAEQLRNEYGLEDDSDKAPSIKIKLYNDTEHERKASGTVWDDSRDTNSDLARIGNGKIDNGEAGVQGVKVELIDMKLSAKYKNTKGTDIVATILVEDSNGNIIDNVAGKRYSWKKAEATTDSNGNYIFSGYIPSNYVMKFTYGLGNEDETIKYNGQDYKSTTYYTPSSNVEYNVNDPDNNAYTYAGTANNPETPQTYNFYGMQSNNTETTYFYNLAQADSDNKNGIRKSDARDVMGNIQTEGTRKYVNNYSNNSGNGVTNELSQQLHDTTPKTYMVAESGQISVELEYNRTESNTSDDVKQNTQNNAGSSNTDNSGYYRIENLDFGLVERPKAQIKITKQVANVKVTLANGNTLFDASSKATNVMWMNHKSHGQDTDNTYTISNNYRNQMMKEPVVRANSSNKGKIQLTMDEELMHGSTLQVTYAITAANIGEVDYLDNQFYYTGKTNNTNANNIARTSADTLIDYVGTQVHNANFADDKTATRNNLQFNKEQNADWNVMTIDEIRNNGLLNNNALENAKKYTTIITTDALKKDLLPIIADENNSKNVADALEKDPLNAIENTVNKTNSVVGVKLVLSQMITQDNSSDDMVYNNMVELVKSSNTVGRRMAYSVAGNQDPTIEPQEIDADDAQEINILPPFGQNYIYYILGFVVAVILIAGIAITIKIVKKK